MAEGDSRRAIISGEYYKDLNYNGIKPGEGSDESLWLLEEDKLTDTGHIHKQL